MMAKQKKLSNDSEAHLGALGVHYKSSELFDGPNLSVTGLRNQDYRWKVKFKDSGREVFCMSLGEAVKAIRATIEPVKQV
jgi:hypothetical protein